MTNNTQTVLSVLAQGLIFALLLELGDTEATRGKIDLGDILAFGLFSLFIFFMKWKDIRKKPSK